MSARWKHPEFRRALMDVAPLAVGVSAWGVMTGVATVKVGMSLFEVLLMTTIVFAGSSQLAALPLIASGAPTWVVLATAFCVNLRFVVFSIHLRPYAMHHGLWRRLIIGYLSADLNYVLLVRRYPHVPTDAAGIEAMEAYWIGTGVAGWTSWTAAGLVGVALGNSVPLEWGLGFAAILALLGVTVSLVSTRLRVVSALIAGGVAVATYALPLRLNIVVAIATAVVVCMLAEQARRAVRT